MEQTVSLEEYRNTAALPDMTVLDGGRRPAPPLPLEMFGPFWSEWIVQQADCLSVPPDFVAYPLLSSAAALVGNTRRAFAWGKWHEPCIIWTAIVGNPSSRKSPAVDVSRELLSSIEAKLAEGFPETLRRWETEKQEAEFRKRQWKEEVDQALKDGLAAPEMPEDAVEPEKPARPRIVVGDTTPEALAHLLLANPRGLLCSRDELSGWLESFGRYNKGGDRALWIEAYGGRPYVVDRVGRAEPLSIERMSISITGGLQPDRVASLLMAGDDDGLCSRFLLTMPEPVRPQRPKITVDSTDALRAFQRLHELQMTFNDEGKEVPVTMPLSPPAVDILEQWQIAAYDQDCDAVGLYGSHLGKLHGAVLRLSLVCEFLGWAAGTEPTPPREISAETVGAVCDFMDSYARPMALRIYGDAALPLAERGAAQIARRIRKEQHHTVNARTIRRKWGLPGLKEADDVKAAIQVLCETNWLAPAGKREGDTKGRPSADYAVNPLVFEAHDG